MPRSFFKFFPALLASVLFSPAQAFDNDFEINDINLSEENFLDMKAHRFRKSQDYAWYDSVSGWRFTGASLDADLAFTQTEVKLQKALSEYVNIRLSMEQEVFYADKEFAIPKAEIEIYPWAGNLGFTFLGTPGYEKRDLDLGLAVIWGRRPWNYLRFEYLDVDALYSQKNVMDNSYYSKDPKTLKLEGAYQLAQHYKLRFSLSHGQPLEFVDPDNSSLFKYEGDDFFLLFDYQPKPDSVIGITVSGFSLDKSVLETTDNRRQATDYISTDIYWVQGMGKKYEIRLGTQYDYISNDIKDFLSSSNDLAYHMDTLQVYGTAYHRFNEHMAWDLGLYLGQVEERQNYIYDNSRDTLNDTFEAKLRMGFEYSSSDGHNTLQVNISINADDALSDPGDGGGISFQSLF